MESIIISDEEDLENKKISIFQDGSNKFHVISDFDRTLTKAFVNGEKTPSIISELRKGNYLSKEYQELANELAEKYHPIEVDSNLSIKEKKKAMHEWWSKHFELLIKSGLNKSHIQKIVDSDRIKPRQKSLEFLDFLHENDIPIVILSSAGLGGDSIRMFLEKHGRLYDNIHIVSNEYEWSSDGLAIEAKKPIIHSFNKDEAMLKNYDFYDKIKDRKNVLLLGDSLGDLEMVHGFNYDTLIKVGFLNENVNENLETYKKNFDLIILNDGSMNHVNKMLKEIFGEK